MRPLIFSLLILVSFGCLSQKLLTKNPHADEVKLIQLINEARTNPKTFLQSKVLPFLADSEEDTVKNKYVSSLLRDLRKQPAMAPLHEDIYLHEQAHSFAADMGKTGNVGHSSARLGSFEKRLKKYSDKATGENCDYGSSDPLEILMNLLIDDGVQGVGHRRNLLNPRFKWIGIGIEPHQTYQWNCVMDFCD